MTDSALNYESPRPAAFRFGRLTVGSGLLAGAAFVLVAARLIPRLFGTFGAGSILRLQLLPNLLASVAILIGVPVLAGVRKGGTYKHFYTIICMMASIVYLLVRLGADIFNVAVAGVGGSAPNQNLRVMVPLSFLIPYAMLALLVGLAGVYFLHLSIAMKVRAMGIFTALSLIPPIVMFLMMILIQIVWALYDGDIYHFRTSMLESLSTAARIVPVVNYSLLALIFSGLTIFGIVMSMRRRNE